MKNTGTLVIQLDDQGHLILPADLLRRYGLASGAVSRLELTDRGFTLSRSADSLAKVYVEVTNSCNFTCRICMRQVWDEPLGWMSEDVFERILDDLTAFDPLPTVFFGGYGEPLAHPRILDMIASARQIGASVELISNGTLLTETVARSLVEIGMDRLWVSIDGATPASYADVRLGDALPQVISNLTRLQDLRAQYGLYRPKLGIAFVAMRRNIAELPEVVRLGRQLGADRFSISNVLPHSEELRGQVLYSRSLESGAWIPSRWSPEIFLPRIDPPRLSDDVLPELMNGENNIVFMRKPFIGDANTCPFLEKGSVSIRWDGAVSPCLPLLHTHKSFLGETLRTSYAFSFDNIRNRRLAEIWEDAGYRKFRQRLQTFDFSPCTICNSCEMAESNLEDCFGNVHPTCGGCLWAQGFIQCP
jgi:MoaA/NifB/PqqE/SkfB family radical SAM enzyme